MKSITFTTVAMAAVLIGAAVAQAGLADFVGTWQNPDKDTRGLTKMVITQQGDRMFVQTWGQAHPQDTDMGKVEAWPYAASVDKPIGTGALALTVEYNHGFGRRLLVLHARGRGVLNVAEYMRFTDGSKRSNYEKSYTMTPLRAVVDVRPVGVKEDCVTFDWRRVEAKLVGNSWKVVDGNHWIMDFGTKGAEAKTALAIIKHYRMNSMCFVGRPDPSMTYFLCDGKAPVGVFKGEDAITFDPAKIEAKQVNGSWKIVQGGMWMLDFGSKADEAKQALLILKKYGFTRQCYVGRPDASMAYFRK